MNTIVILIDSLNFHCLEPYGASHVNTPNLQRLADRAVLFDNHFVGSLPCMPARRELFTGRQEFLWRGWGHIEPWDRHLATDVAASGAVTQMITDHYHYWEHAAHGYFEPFHGAEFVRGHELDLWQTEPFDETPAWAKAIDRFRGDKARVYDGWGSAYYANARQWQSEADFSCAQVMQKSADWLDANHSHDHFCLWIESFDPHEPHYVPEPYRSMYVDTPAPGNFNCWPPYQNAEECQRFIAQASDAELAWIRAQYYGKITLVDRWLGKVFDRMDALGLWDNTAVVLTTDHGHDLCHDRHLHPIPWGKQFPHPESHARIPLMIWHPEHPGNGRRVDAMTCTVDINATVRELNGCADVEGPDGRSLMGLVRGDTTSHRDWVLYGMFGQGTSISTRDWTLSRGSRGTPYNWYSTTSQCVSAEMSSGKFIPGVDVPQWRVPVTAPTNDDYLWSRESFSLTPRNVIEQYPDVCVDMEQQLRGAVESVGCPPETFARLGLD